MNFMVQQTPDNDQWEDSQPAQDQGGYQDGFFEEGSDYEPEYLEQAPPEPSQDDGAREYEGDQDLPLDIEEREDIGTPRSPRISSEGSGCSRFSLGSRSSMSPRGSMSSTPSMSAGLPEEIQNAIWLTLPKRRKSNGPQNGKKPKKRKIGMFKRLFKLARLIRAIPGYEQADQHTLGTILCVWHRQAEAIGNPPPFADCLDHFLYAHEKARKPMGNGDIELLYEEALQMSLPPEIVQRVYQDEMLVRYAKLCQRLQHNCGVESFPLDCRTAARLVLGDEDEYRRAAKHLKLLCILGILKLKEKGDHFARREKGQMGRASRYWYIPEQPK
jgi:hypothetical protein